MKKGLLKSVFGMVWVMLFGAMAISSCNQDACSDITCQNGAICREGSCQCPVGYEGPYCEQFVYTKFLGTYSGTIRYNEENPQNATIEIRPGDAPNKVLFRFPNDPYTEYMAFVDGTTIRNGSFVNSIGNTYTISGYVEEKKVSINVVAAYIDENKDASTFNGMKQ